MHLAAGRPLEQGTGDRERAGADQRAGRPGGGQGDRAAVAARGRGAHGTFGRVEDGPYPSVPTRRRLESAAAQSSVGGSRRGANTSSMGRGPTYWRHVHGTHVCPDHRPRRS